MKFSSPGCFAVEPGPRYGVKEFGGVSGEQNMQKEIWSRGPIVCSLAADLSLVLEYEAHLVDGVYIDPTYFPADGSPSPHTAAEVDHDVEVTGWGTTESGVPYWVARNSWGTYWGERGWFKILRGSDHLFIESDCAWAVPDLDDLESSLSSHMVGDYVSGHQVEPKDEEDPRTILSRIQRQVDRTAHDQQGKQLFKVDEVTIDVARVAATVGTPRGDARSHDRMGAIGAIVAGVAVLAALVVVAPAARRTWKAHGMLSGRDEPLLDDDYVAYDQRA